MKLRVCGVLIVACAILLGASLAHADSVTVDDVLFTGTVTSSTVTVTIQCTVTSVCGSWYIGDVTLKGFTFTGTPTTDSGSASGWVVVNGGQNNDAIATGGGCDSSSGLDGKAVCWDANLPLATQLGTSTITLIADLPNGDGSIDDVLHVQATGYTNTGGVGTGGGKPLAVSNDLTGAVITTPEPNTLVFLGSGLLALTLLGRRLAAPSNRS